MMGAVDRQFCIKLDQGCAGRAFESKREMVVDLTEKAHEDFNIDSRDVWSEMKSILSVPIFEDEEHTKVKGVLNVDSDLIVANTKFFDTTVIRVVRIYSDWISGMI
jgi:putative methionine-R-sulfoxide reductase with GAF domain